MSESEKSTLHPSLTGYKGGRIRWTLAADTILCFKKIACCVPYMVPTTTIIKERNLNFVTQCSPWKQNVFQAPLSSSLETEVIPW